MNKCKIIYAVYKGDQFIDLGTKNELAKKLNVRPDTIKFYSTPANWKRYDQALQEEREHIVAIKIGKVGDELDESRDPAKVAKSK